MPRKKKPSRAVPKMSPFHQRQSQQGQGQNRPKVKSAQAQAPLPDFESRMLPDRMYWDANIEEEFLATIREGGSLKDAAAIAMVAFAIVMQRMTDEPMFLARVQYAQAECKMGHIRKINEGAKGWNSSAWFLERRHAEEYSLSSVGSAREEKVIRVRRLVRSQVLDRPALPPSEPPAEIHRSPDVEPIPDRPDNGDGDHGDQEGGDDVHG
jgi:hypothetical protein